MIVGTLSTVPVPSQRRLDIYTEQVARNNHYGDESVTDRSEGNPVPAPGGSSPIKHVIYIGPDSSRAPRSACRACKLGVMEPTEILRQAADTLTVRRVFGEPIERDGVLVVPVARVRGGGGAGGGEGQGGEGEGAGRGSGGGWGAEARPIGVFVIAGGDVRWVPAFDLNRVILGGQVVAVLGLLVLRSLLRRRGRRRR